MQERKGGRMRADEGGGAGRRSRSRSTAEFARRKLVLLDELFQHSSPLRLSLAETSMEGYQSVLILDSQFAVTVRSSAPPLDQTLRSIRVLAIISSKGSQTDFVKETCGSEMKVGMEKRGRGEGGSPARL